MSIYLFSLRETLLTHESKETSMLFANVLVIHPHLCSTQEQIWFIHLIRDNSGSETSISRTLFPSPLCFVYLGIPRSCCRESAKIIEHRCSLGLFCVYYEIHSWCLEQFFLPFKGENRSLSFDCFSWKGHAQKESSVHKDEISSSIILFPPFLTLQSRSFLIQ